MASPFPFRPPHEQHHLPEDWTDTDQHIIEWLLLPGATATVGDGARKDVGDLSEDVDAMLEKSDAVVQPASTATPAAKKKRPSRKRVSIEEKRMKHREVQRRFMQRKKEGLAQVKRSITTLEKQLEIMKISTERALLESENQTLQDQIAEAAVEKVHEQVDLLQKFQDEIPLVEKIYRPVSPQRWEEIVCQTLSIIDTIFLGRTLASTGLNVLGWTDHRNVEDSTVKFMLSKTFPHVCAEELWSRSWERISTDSYASFFSPSLHVRKHLLQRVCDDAIIIYRGICYPNMARISRAVEIISRVRRANDFVFFIRSLDMTEVQRGIDAPDVWTQSLTALRFVPTNPEHPEVGCTVDYGGSYEKIPRGGERYWLMEILFLVLRFETSLISPMFALCD